MPKLSAFDEMMKEFPVAKFNEFSELVDLARKFGNDAVKNKLQAKPSNKLTEKEIFELLSRGVSHYNSTFNEELSVLQNRLSTQYHQPRAIPSLTEKQKEELQKQGPGKGQNYQQVPWLKNNVDDAADPRVRDAVIQNAARNIAKDPRSFTEQFNNVVKAEAQYRLALKMAPKMRMGYQPPKPRPQ